MVATGAQFSKNIRRRGRQVENAPTRAVKKIATRALIELVNGTPVDKGVARSNWRVGIGNPTSAVIRAYSPGKKLGMGESANASAAIAAGRARIAAVRATSGGLKTSIYINNNTPYIGKLEAGYSPQNSHWIYPSLARAAAEIENMRIFADGD